MPLLLAIALAIALLLALGLVLLPLSLWQRWRSGSARRPAQPAWVTLNLWLSLGATLVLMLSAAVASLWWPQAGGQAGLGLLAGLMLGALGHALTRFEAMPTALFYQPNRWLVLALTALVLVRLLAGLVQGWQVVTGAGRWPASGWMSHAGLLAMAALLLGYAVMYAWLLRRRLRRYLRYRGYDRSR